MNKQVYKKVALRDGKRYSAFVGAKSNHDDFGLDLEYAEGLVTVPKEGKIFAFNTLENAKNWHYWGSEIWLAAATDVKPCRRYIFCDCGEIARYLSRFWSGKEVGNRKAPKGTVLCSSLTLLRREM